MCKRCWIKDFLSSSLLSRLSYDFSLTFIQTLWRWVGGWQNNEGWKRKKGWKMTVRGSDLLHWDGLRAHREDHPLQQSRVAHSERGRGRGRGERRGRQNRHLLLLVPTAWLEQKSGTGVWILDFSFTERLPEQMERYGENGWETEERHRARDSKRLFFFFHGTEQTLPLSQCHSSLARHLIFFLSRSTTVCAPPSSSFFRVLIYSVAVDELTSHQELSPNMEKSSSMTLSLLLTMTVSFFCFLSMSGFLVLVLSQSNMMCDTMQTDIHIFRIFRQKTSNLKMRS